jgi:hypothetical protein
MKLHGQTLLRAALLADALASAAIGLLLTVGAEALAAPLGLPPALLRGAGLLLLPFAAFVGWLGRRAAAPRSFVVAVVAINALWTLESLALAFGPWAAPTALGVVFVTAQALAVAALGAAQAIALTQTRATPA